MSDKHNELYDTVKGLNVEKVKIILQMIIGLIIVMNVCYFILQYFLYTFHLYYFDGHENFDLKIGTLLEPIGYGLAASAGIDLGYMLFTPDLDEAVDPLIIALSATAIVVLSKEEVSTKGFASLAIAVIVASIGVLLWFERPFSAVRGMKKRNSWGGA